MQPNGWHQLINDWPWFGRATAYPLPAYSEFVPPPRLGRRAYGDEDPFLFEAEDPWGWYVSEYEELLELQPGLKHVANQLLTALRKLGEGKKTNGLARARLAGNPCWPDELSRAVGSLEHEQHVLLLTLALSRTQDDKGRVRWTVFGCCEQGPARPFWQSFFHSPGHEQPEEQSLAFVRDLLADVYDIEADQLDNLHKAGLRFLPCETDGDDPVWQDGPLPRWVEPFRMEDDDYLRHVRWILTFRPFSRLPARVRHAYLEGKLHLLPCPYSLVFWGAPGYRRLQQELPLARQVPLLEPLTRSEALPGLRIPQVGWIRDLKGTSTDVQDPHGPVRNTYRRSHRWEKILRNQDPLALTGKESHLARVLFSTNPDDLGLYGKPMARNVQLWTHDFHRILDGPNATYAEMVPALKAMETNKHLGYRFQFPAMRVGQYEVYWHRPLVAFPGGRGRGTVIVPDAVLGQVIAYADTSDPALKKFVHLWPRIRQRESHTAAIELFRNSPRQQPYQTTCNVRKLLETRELMGTAPLPRTLARQLLNLSKHKSLEDWLDHLPDRASNQRRVEELVEELVRQVDPKPRRLPRSLTYRWTARRSFEVNFWKTIASLADGPFLTQNNADCVLDPITQSVLAHLTRDLDALGDHLLHYYRQLVQRVDHAKGVLVGDLPFRWETEFPYPWMGGWKANQNGTGKERDLIVVIPGRDRSRAVIMADHYDTAFMADRYDKKYGGNGARLASSGADDNHSATTALMLGAPVFLELSKAGQLECDIWLVHLTGEEFPADCLGARRLTRFLVEKNLQMRLADGSFHNLADTRVQGVFVLDMIAHNNDRDRNLFQIAPGKGAASMWLATQAHIANEIWNAGVPRWNQRKQRLGSKPPRRRPHAGAIPALFPHVALSGEVRPHYDPRSTLYNTDGQIFSDAGVPVVLFMENYDINRSGYHDTHDTMANIDLDYGAALAAIAIETVARAASERPPDGA